MGSLHEGHLSLVRQARSLADVVVVSIFVNPTQFGPNEDLDSYPRELDADLVKLDLLEVDAVFAPSNHEMYPSGFSTSVRVTGLTDRLCGASRPRHFHGVTTVVSVLFNLVQPDVALFGRKDYQQLAVIRRMTRDMGYAIEIVSGPTVREPDGLALSSRNLSLSPEQRESAPALSRALRAVSHAFEDGERRGRTLLDLGRRILEAEPELRIDYFELFDPDNLAPLVTDDSDMLPEQVHMALAVFAGDIRLIDNLRLGGES
jgi:pantoate--beta-alanine ligase